MTKNIIQILNNQPKDYIDKFYFRTLWNIEDLDNAQRNDGSIAPVKFDEGGYKVC